MVSTSRQNTGVVTTEKQEERENAEDKKFEQAPGGADMKTETKPKTVLPLVPTMVQNHKVKEPPTCRRLLHTLSSACTYTTSFLAPDLLPRSTPTQGTEAKLDDVTAQITNLIVFLPQSHKSYAVSGASS